MKWTLSHYAGKSLNQYSIVERLSANVYQAL